MSMTLEGGLHTINNTQRLHGHAPPASLIMVFFLYDHKPPHFSATTLATSCMATAFALPLSIIIFFCIFDGIFILRRVSLSTTFTS